MKNNTKSQILELQSLGLHRYASWALYDTPQSQVIAQIKNDKK